jgi:hypothetical protein
MTSSACRGSGSGAGRAVVFAILGAALFAASTPARAGESVPLRIEPAAPALAADRRTGTPVRPGDGEVLVLGTFDEASFRISDLSHFAVEAPDGSRPALTIDRSRVYEEFGEIVSVAFLFAIPASQASDAGFVLHWGPEVEAEHRVIDRVSLEEIPADRLRTFTVGEGAPPPGATESFATIEVIADRNADYYSLWYLLPMLLIFILLTVRKLAGDAARAD